MLRNTISHLDITGSDFDPRMIQIAQENAAEAGFIDLINWQQQDVRDLDIEWLKRCHGWKSSVWRTNWRA